jgi:AcrR family transcriptional regulator
MYNRPIVPRCQKKIFMSGKPQFDEQAVIAAAVTVFWRYGYATASINNLTEATGLSRSSIKQRFGDKDGLFLEALQAYKKRVLKRMNAVEADTARDQLEALLRAFLPGKLAAGQPPGCLIARSYIEAVALSETGQVSVMSAVAEQREVFASILRKAAENGELRHDADIDALAWHYFGVLQTVLNFSTAGADENMLNRMIDVAMAGWPTCKGA